MKKYFLLLLFSFSFHTLFAQTWTPERSIQQAIEASPGIHSLKNQLAAKEAALVQARAISNPKVGGVAGNRTRMLAVGQEIAYPAKRKVRIRTAEAEREAVRWQLSLEQHEIAAQTATELYQILAADRQVELAQQNLAVIQQLLSVTQQKFDQGFGSRLDVIKGQVEVARAKRRLLTARKEAIARRSNMKLVLGLPSADTLIVADVLNAAFFPGQKTLESLLQTARKNHPGLQLQGSLVREAALNVEAARLDMRPDFDLDLSGGVEDDESKIELELRLPLPLWDRKAGLRSEAKFSQESAENDRAAAWLEISRQVTRAYYNYLNAQQAMGLFSQSLLDEAKTAADLALQLFQTGTFRFLDLIDARRTYLETAEEFIEAQAELRLEEIEILRATGTPFPGEKR